MKKREVFSDVYARDFERYHELRNCLSEEDALQAMLEDKAYLDQVEEIQNKKIQKL